MSLQSDAAKAYIENLLNAAYIAAEYHQNLRAWLEEIIGQQNAVFWHREYRFAPPRRWAFDYAVPAILCANHGGHNMRHYAFATTHTMGVIEIDGGTFQSTRTGHSSGVGLRAWREKNNAAMTAGWRVWHYAPEEIIKAGRKCLGYPNKTQENPRDGYVNLAWAKRRNPAR